MNTKSDLNVSAMSAMRGLTVNVRVTGLRWMRLRHRVGLAVVRLGFLIVGTGCSVDIES